jgi:ferrochelatase
MDGVGYEAIVLVSFGGPEGPEDVMPFLRNVVRGRGVPDERLAEVAHHYQHFGGISPINQQCRDLLAALRPELDGRGIDLPLYWGNRNWDPYLTETLITMRDDRITQALAFVTSPFGSYSSCRQYLDDIDQARAAVGPDAPRLDKIRHYHDHPGYVEPFVDAVSQARTQLSDVDPVRLVFTAHSIPSTMEQTSGPDGHRYTAQLNETAALVAAGAGFDTWDLVWQSRSGPPQVPWLEPDINDHLATLPPKSGVIACPIGFISDHLEVIWDLDTEAVETAQNLDISLVRAATPGNDPRFVSLVGDLVQERLDPAAPRRRLGQLPVWDVCPAGCCPAPKRPA